MIWKQSDVIGDGNRGQNSVDDLTEKVQNETEPNEDNKQDLDFLYDDSDEYTAEIAELYSYTEDEEFNENKLIFYEEFYKKFPTNTKWIELTDSSRKSFINGLAGMFDSGVADVRRRASRSLLYILQGVFGECELEEDLFNWSRYNVFLCLECGIFNVLIDMLLLEIKYEEWSNSNPNVNENDQNSRVLSKKPSVSTSTSVSMNSTVDLRVVLNMIYIVIESVRTYKIKHNDSDTKRCANWLKLVDDLIEELNDGISSLGSVEDAPNLMIVLFGMIHRFCSGLAPNFPMKKVLLILWKSCLLIMGPVTGLFDMKNKKRESLNLAKLTEDSHQIIRYMKASNLPTSPADLLEAAVSQQHQMQLNGGLNGAGLNNRSSTRAGRLIGGGNNQGPKQGSLAGGRSKLMSGGESYGNNGRSFRPSLMLDGVDDNNGLSGGNNAGRNMDEIDDDVDEDDEDGDEVDFTSNKSDDSSNDSSRTTTMLDDSRNVDEAGDEDDDEDDRKQEENALRLVENSLMDEDTIFDAEEDRIDNLKIQSNDSSEKKSPHDQSIAECSETGYATPRPNSPTKSHLNSDQSTSDQSQHQFHHLIHQDFKPLPWKPKVKARDLELFMDTVRAKFIGYPISGQDSVTLAGLPLPIQDAVKVLKNHLYISIGEVQIKQENEILQFPLSKGSKEKIENTPAEKLYRNMLPMIPQYMIALLKILLAAAPTSKSKTESINILAEIIPDEISSSISKSIKLNYDANRHKEIIVKSISGLLLLLLKHFKLNHIYQFEYVSQHLVFANCIPLVLKFFNQNILNYVQAKNSLSQLDFPACVFGDEVEINSEAYDLNEQSSYCWRNLFSCINLLRILNMLTKWKHSRTMMMVVFKSPPILKRALKVRQAMLQLYVLKLLKSQTRYSGRQWRKTNMQIMSAIYQKVRHRLTDDWAYGNDVDARPWDFQAEECSLRTSVNRFNNRRYLSPSVNDSLDAEMRAGGRSMLYNHQQEHTDDDTGGASSHSDNESYFYAGFSRGAELRKAGSFDVPLSQEFMDNYERWLQHEVYSSVPINWDQVLAAR